MTQFVRFARTILHLSPISGTALAQAEEKRAKERENKDAGDNVLGMKLSPLNAEWRDALNLSPQSVGLVVEAVKPNSPSARVGLQRGMVVVRINRMEVQSVDDAKKALERNKDGLSLMHIWYEGRTATAVIKDE